MTIEIRLLAIALAIGAGTGANSRPAAIPGPSEQAMLKAAEDAMLGDPRVVLKLTADARVQIGRAGNRELSLARVLWLEGEAHGRLGNIAAADRSLREATALVSRAEPRGQLHARIIMSRGATAFDQGQVQRAFTDFRDAFAIFQRLGDTRGQALALQSMGMIYTDAGDYTRVLRYYAQSAEIHPGDRRLAMSALNNQGLARKELGALAEAERDYRRALQYAREVQSAANEALILANIATVELDRGELAQASSTVDQGLALARRKAPEGLAQLWGVKARITFKRGDEAAAVAMLPRVFGRLTLDQTNFLFRDVHQMASDAYLKLGDPVSALAHLRAVNRLDAEAREIRSSTNAALIAAQFDYASQELRIARRDADLARSRARTQWIMLGASLLLLAASLVAFLWIRRSRNETRVANVQLGKALAAKSEFLATTSHEIRTPLNGIMGMTQVLLGNRALAPDVKERVELIDSAGKAMKAIVDDLLDMAKIEAGEVVVSRCDIALLSLLDEAARFWQSDAGLKGLRVVADLSNAPARIVEDERKLRQIVFNLMSNAVKFTVSGSVTLTVTVDAGHLQIIVADTGIGIPADQLHAIFEPFHQVDGATTRQHSGTGLGLAISRKLARELGGDITVDSSDRGSRFTVSLPLRIAEPVELPVPVAGAPLDLASARVMLIDANPLFQSLAGACLDGHVGAFSAIDDADDAGPHLAATDVIVVDVATVDTPRAVTLCAALPVPRALFLLAPGADADAFELPDGVHASAINKALPPLNMVPALAQLIAGALSKLERAA